MIRCIAIRGQEEGWEVINLIKMFGGINFYSLTGKGEDVYYYIKPDGYIWHIFLDDMLLDEWNLYTYDSFKETYPFINGNMVTVQGWREPGYVTSSYIKDSQVFYDIVFNDKHKSMARGVCADCMKFYNHTNNSILTIKEDMKNNIEFDLEKYSYEVKDGKLIVNVKSLRYPKTYEKCCEVLGISYRAQLSYTYPDVEHNNIYLTKEKHLLDAFMKLRICRNAYWKIAGEEMGLDKPWEPDWKSMEQKKYCIYYGMGIIQKGSWWNYNSILAFPTEEMRDAFFENFKDLIESCKELL